MWGFQNPDNSGVVRVVTVQTRKEMKEFIQFPWKIYKDNLVWVPPLKSAVEKLLDRKRHPFWKFSRGEFFLAKRGESVVGRIVVLIDRRYNEYHGELMGAWGFFECENDPEAAVSLFQAAEKWAEDAGMEFLRGPLNPSTNYETGMLIHGFDKQPALMMPYNPAYYLELTHAAGYRKEKDLYSYRFSKNFELPDWVYDISEKLSQKEDVRISFPKKWTKEDIRLLCSVYHECWRNNWGFVPTTEEEELELASNLLPILEPEYAFFMHKGDDIAGIGLLVPDFNPLLKRLNGKLGIGALVKKLLYESEITGFRGMLFGIKDSYRHLGLPLLAFRYLHGIYENDPKFQYVELGWNLEDNDEINRLYEDAGLRPDKRYRVYRKDIM